MSDVAKTWTRHFDEKFKSWYFYNEESKESVWEGEKGAAEIELSIIQRESEYSSQVPTKLKTKSKAHQKNKRISGFANFLRESASSDMESKESDNLLDEARNDEHSPTKDEILFVRFSICNAILFEGVLCCMEGVVRCVVLAFIALSLCCGSMEDSRETERKSHINKLRQIFRDFLLTLSVSALFLIPGYVYFAYRNNSPHQSWHISPLPTCFGSVDPRRFVSITIFGFGRLAANSMHRRYTSQGTLVEDFPLDGWSDSLVYYPKDVIKECSNLLYGSTRTESLDAIFV